MTVSSSSTAGRSSTSSAKSAASLKPKSIHGHDVEPNQSRTTTTTASSSSTTTTAGRKDEDNHVPSMTSTTSTTTRRNDATRRRVRTSHLAESGASTASSSKVINDSTLEDSVNSISSSTMTRQDRDSTTYNAKNDVNNQDMLIGDNLELLERDGGQIDEGQSIDDSDRLRRHDNNDKTIKKDHDKNDAEKGNNNDDDDDELLDYEEDDEDGSNSFSLGAARISAGRLVGKPLGLTQHQSKTVDLTKAQNVVDKSGPTSKIRGAYSSIHSSGFRDFILRPELMKSISNSGFEHPSTVQHETIPQAILGMDILCQAKSGMGKTAVFVISTLQLLNPKHDKTSVLVIAHTRELALQISKEYERFSKYLPVKVRCFLGGIPMSKDLETLKSCVPHVVVGTPGRILALIDQGAIKVDHLRHFVVDEADKVLSQLSMRSTVQKIFKATPKDKQTMMFSATMPKEMQELCKKFMQDPLEVTIDDDKKLTLHGLHQYYLKLTEKDKNKKLVEILDALEFNQVMIFVKDARRATALASFLKEQNFPTAFIHGAMAQDERISRFESFKAFQTRIMVSTDLFGRGIDVNKVNVVINYDMPDSTDTYLHRVGRAGRFGTKGLALTFLADSNDCDLMNNVQSRFEVQIKDLPNTLDPNSYMEVTDKNSNNINNSQSVDVAHLNGRAATLKQQQQQQTALSGSEFDTSNVPGTISSEAKKSK